MKNKAGGKRKEETIMKLARIIQLRPPKWSAVKKQYNANIHTRYGKIWAVTTGVTALGMTAALLSPTNPIVHFFGGYSLACFLPTLNLLQLRKWNRTLAFPAALLYSAVSLLALLADINFNNMLTTLFLCVTFIIGATSDRLSPIYKLTPPFDHFGIVAVAFFLFLVVYFSFMFFAVAALLIVALIALMIAMIRSLFGYRRYGRWY
jgi:hypothetical protein